ncbi:hypothetical protein BLA60_21440 [Actinophytocola xinjiangensis]|uniref:Uncharacterized protein n=1 Tax=Actinophytocola xinjiangensis TaxID=485602 RepID=A0A7Z0WKY6_9PSEU|nr:hypothetical protein [Actinophytocola xinjiangensis]OLF09139.1 hypothetical protein BLA60_21440 [Actinophytocola xinjiangensis]
MHASLFSLVTADDPTVVFGWGMEIVDHQDGDESRKTIVHIGSPKGQGTVSMHESAEHARNRWSMVVPVDIVWDADDWADAIRLTSANVLDRDGSPYRHPQL